MNKSGAWTRFKGSGELDSRALANSIPLRVAKTMNQRSILSRSSDQGLTQVNECDHDHKHSPVHRKPSTPEESRGICHNVCGAVFKFAGPHQGCFALEKSTTILLRWIWHPGSLLGSKDPGNGYRSTWKKSEKSSIIWTRVAFYYNIELNYNYCYKLNFWIELLHMII